MNAAPSEPAGGEDLAQDLAWALRHPLSVDDDVIRLRGRPGELTGVVSITRAPEPVGLFRAATQNFHETRVGYLHRLRHAPMLSSSAPIDHSVPRHLALANTLAPGASGAVPVSFSLPPTTPAGIYHAVFDVAGEPREAEFEVLPDERLEISPGAITIAGAAGDVVTEELILTNHGNAPVMLDVLGVLVLQEEQQICLGLQEALAAVQAMGTRENAHRVFLDTLVGSIADKRTDFGRVRLENGPLLLAAGAAARAPVAFHLPSNMNGGRRYEAELQAGQATLQVHIIARGRPARKGKGGAAAA